MLCGLHYYAEGSHFATDGQGSFCKQHYTDVGAHISKGFAFIVVLRGMNSTWMNPSLSQNRDAVNFPVDWQAFNFLPLEGTGSFRCIPRCLVPGVKWNIHVPSPVTVDCRNWLSSSLNRRKLETTISKRRCYALPSDILPVNVHLICTIPVTWRITLFLCTVWIAKFNAVSEFQIVSRRLFLVYRLISMPKTCHGNLLLWVR